jgi:hypothetical protein
MKYYIVDPTLENRTHYFDRLQDVITHLEGTVKRKFRQTRGAYMQNLLELGHCGDDRDGKSFVDSLYRFFDIGIVHDDKRHVKCNVHDVKRYSAHRTEMGD